MYKKICGTVLILVVSVLLYGCGSILKHADNTYTLPPNKKVVSFVYQYSKGPSILTRDMTPTDTAETYYVYRIHTAELDYIIKEIKQ